MASLLLIVVGPLAAMIIQMAISRSREFMADEEGARISHAPMALADALLKLEAYAHRVPMERATPRRLLSSSSTRLPEKVCCGSFRPILLRKRGSRGYARWLGAEEVLL